MGGPYLFPQASVFAGLGFQGSGRASEALVRGREGAGGQGLAGVFL